jgi:hypothetical protein
MQDKKDTRGVNTNISYFTLRKVIGYCGFMLPWLAMAVSRSVESSISDYYYTFSGVIFTSILVLTGAFLITYRGYEKEDEKISDNVITWIGGIMVIIVAAVPTPFIGDATNCPTPICHDSTIYGIIHFGSAVILFIAMGYLSAVHFCRGKKPFTKAKKIRNVIYLVCGFGMWATLVVTGILILAGAKPSLPYLILVVEIIMLTLFGISWLVKGKALVDFRIQKEE